MNRTHQPIFPVFRELALLALILLAACAIQPSSQPLPKPSNTTASSNLPDLTISSISLVMQGQNNQPCVQAYGPYEIRVVVTNQGSAPANSIVVERTPGAQDLIETLAAGERQAVQFPAIAVDGKYLVQVDPQNVIAESNEDNNRQEFLAPTPTPPMICTPSQPAATSPAATPVPNSTNSLAGLVYDEMNLAR